LWTKRSLRYEPVHEFLGLVGATSIEHFRLFILKEDGGEEKLTQFVSLAL
jgi:hypothetical protein